MGKIGRKLTKEDLMKSNEKTQEKSDTDEQRNTDEQDNTCKGNTDEQSNAEENEEEIEYETYYEDVLDDYDARTGLVFFKKVERRRPKAPPGMRYETQLKKEYLGIYDSKGREIYDEVPEQVLVHDIEPEPEKKSWFRRLFRER